MSSSVEGWYKVRDLVRWSCGSTALPENYNGGAGVDFDDTEFDDESQTVAPAWANENFDGGPLEGREEFSSTQSPGFDPSRLSDTSSYINKRDLCAAVNRISKTGEVLLKLLHAAGVF